MAETPTALVNTINDELLLRNETNISLDKISSKRWKKRGHEFYSTHDGRFDLFSGGFVPWVCMDSDLGKVRQFDSLELALAWVEKELTPNARPKRKAAA